MTLKNLRNEFILQLTECDYTHEKIEKLSNDVHALLFIEHHKNTEMLTIAEMFDDPGFHEFLEMQYEKPITFNAMINMI